ncbi:MAG: MFS transporter [Acidobacteria bacterium]|nr:MFS transporter [Acidobacteriota bacterium]
MTEDPRLTTGQQPRLIPGAGRRALGGFFLSGLLFSFLGPILPAWGYHLHSDYPTVALYFLFLTFGIYAGAHTCQWLAPRAGLRALLIAGSALGCAALIALAFASGPVPPSYRMFGLFAVGAAGAIVNTAVFHAITPLYEHDPASTINLSGALFGFGCLSATLITVLTFNTYEVASILFLFAVIPFYFLISYIRGGEFAYIAQELPSLKEALRDFKSPGAILFTLLLFFQFGNEWAIASWLPLFLIQRLGVSPASALYLLATYWTALVAGRVVAQALLPRYKHSHILAASVIAAMLGCVLLSLTEKMGGAVVGIALIGCGFASIYPLVSESIEHRFPYYHPGFYGGIFSLGLTGALLTPSLLGAIAAQWGVGKVMLLPALGAMMVAVLVLLIWLEARLTKA